jgi:hypothetical protein
MVIVALRVTARCYLLQHRKAIPEAVRTRLAARLSELSAEPAAPGPSGEVASAGSSKKRPRKSVGRAGAAAQQMSVKEVLGEAMPLHIMLCRPGQGPY